MNRPFVAVVDDDVSVRRALARMLRASRFDVAVFESGEALLASLETRTPDCVILDYQLAGNTAPDVQKLLAQTPRKISVVVVTAHERPGMRKRCLANGASSFLLKPLRCDELIASLTTAIQQTNRK